MLKKIALDVKDKKYHGAGRTRVSYQYEPRRVQINFSVVC